jgi:membrane protein
MDKLIGFFITLGKQSLRDEILPLASELTYRLILALFPFLIFLMSLVGFFNINSRDVMFILEELFPEEMMEIISGYVREVVEMRRTGVLSFSLLIAVYSASSGFKAVIRGINRAYGTKETRKFITVWLIRASLVFVMAFAVISSILLLVFGDALHLLFMSQFGINRYAELIFGLAGDLTLLAVLLATIVLIYKLGSCKKLTVYQVLPGALVTLIVWIAASKIFNIYINNFAGFSVIYGSIAGIFITMLWINIISTVILLGAEINSLLEIY